MSRLRGSALVIGAILLFSGAVLTPLVDELFAIAAGIGVVLLLPARGRAESGVLDGSTFYGSGHDGAGGRGATGGAPDSMPPTPLE